MNPGLTFDRIQVPHEISLCRPVPTNNWDHNKVPGQTECGVFVRDLKAFPYNDEPSGGSSNRISPSEMFLAYVKLNNYPGSGRIRIIWARMPENTTMFDFAIDVPAKKDASWSWWFWEAYSFIGNFANEVNHLGDYYVIISTTWGDARYDFKAIDSRIDEEREKAQSLAIENMQAQIFTQQARIDELEGLLAKNSQQDEKDRQDSAVGIAGIWAGLEAWLVERILGILLKGLDREVKGMK